MYELLLGKVEGVKGEILKAKEREEQLQEVQMSKSKSEGCKEERHINLDLQRIARWL